ncbi:MAG: efflux RND transporter permease subunit [Actinomycetota bacterium]
MSLTTAPPDHTSPTAQHTSSRPTDGPERSTRLTAALYRRLGRVLVVVGAITALLVVPFLTMAPTESASTEPSGNVFTARDRIDERFVSNVHATFVIAEHTGDNGAADDGGGDLLRAEPLTELLAANDAVRADPIIGPDLLRYYEDDADADVVGILSLAELVDRQLRTEGIDGLAAATDADVKSAGAALIERYGERSDLLGISAESTRDENDDWIVPAVNFPVLADNDALGFGNVSVNLGGDTDVEEYDRSVQDVLRTADGFQVNGVAIDVNLTSEEQGAVAGPFIGFTILAALLLVGLTFRSYWVLATVSVAFLVLLVWLKGISNLIGLRDDLVLSLIVPIAMISFGVDFAFHAIGRYRESRADGLTSAPAVVGGLAAVSGALVLALVSDSVAFLANVTAGIESIIGFGVGAAIALASAFVLLGIVAPLVVARIESDVAAPAVGRSITARRVGAGLGAASMTMGSVLLLVFILPWLGVILSVLTAVAVLGVPYLVARRRRLADDRPALGDLPHLGGESGLAAPIGRTVSALARRPAPVLGGAVLVTAVAATFAVQVPAEFDVQDFFSPDTDFVVSLDQLDQHVGDRGGEPAILYVEGDLSDPAALALLASSVDDVRSLDTPALARDDDGRVDIEAGVFEVFDETWASPIMTDVVAQQAGVALTDADGDRIPDTREQIEALVAVATEIGVPIDAERVSMTPDDVATSISLDGDVPATLLRMNVVDSRAQQSVAAAKADLAPVADAIARDLGGTFVEVTGSPFIREASLDATNRALQISLPIAVLLCLLVAAGFLRSIRYGLASIVPILMVVAWLYAFMEIAGYSINLVTATIAAVSIGIGIDFAIHFIARFREELERHGSRHVAVRVSGEGTGLALVASAATSAVGFAILALAPMPLFASYGLLTALMIVMALVATLAVLPSLLVLITRDRHPSPSEEPDAAQPTPRR